MPLLVAFALAACLSIAPDSDQIRVRDLVAAYPALANVDQGTEIAFAPAPGVTRVYREPDLRMLAARFHLGVDSLPEPFCVKRPVAQLDAPALLEAMKQSLPGARIEVLDFLRQAVPLGELDFPVTGLRVPQGPAAAVAAQGAVWSGSVRYAGTRRFAVWARVRVLVTSARILAVSDLRTGQPIVPAQISAEVREEFPTAAPFAQSVEDVTGRCPRLAIRAGSAIRLDQLEKAKEIVAGQPVHVEVRNGAARLEFEGVAESSGATGETIFVRNPSSKKRFRATVEGKGHVSVDANPTTGEDQQ